MCGINGITAPNRLLVEVMNFLLKHRGPDGSNVYEDDGITLGHTRLAIIDLHERSAQPMVSNDGKYVIVYNGELYNYRELREQLRGDYSFKTESDTEVILAAYAKWGEKCLNMFRGIFAFGIWDTEEHSLLLVRDHVGVKPLYYSISNGILSFSSELKALLSTKKNVIQKESLSLYLSLNYVPNPHSLVSGVHKLEPSQMLMFKNGTLTLKKYWAPKFVPKKKTSSNEIYNVIDGAVSRQLVSDRPVGVFLSGGIDSSVILHHTTKHSGKAKTFSVGFEMVPGAEADEDRFNADAKLAKRTAEFYGAEHSDYTITLQDVRNNFEAALLAIDEPVANPTFISQYLLSKWVREDGVVVALGGDGGDELFAGYTRHRILMAAYYFQKFPKIFQRGLGLVHHRLGKLGTDFPVPIHISLLAVKDKTLNQIWKGTNLFEKETGKFFEDLYHRHTGSEMHQLDAFLQIDRGTWLADESLARSDKSSMRHGLEMRVPLLDLDVVELSDAISIYQKVTPRTGKTILRKAYKNHLPDFVLNQPKRGWISPGAKWFRDPVILEFVKEVFTDSYHSGLSSCVDWDAVQKMLDDHVEKKAYFLHPLWDLLVLQVWAKKYNMYL